MVAGSVLAFANLCSKNCASDCPDAPIGDECGANVVYETDLYGGDYKNVPVSDWHECCKLCASEAECRAWCGTTWQGVRVGAVGAPHPKQVASPSTGPGLSACSCLQVPPFTSSFFTGLQNLPSSLCCRTYTDQVCYMKDDSWTTESYEGRISGYYSSS